MSLAEANIREFNPAWVSADKPAVFTCDVNSYSKIMKGSLLDQWTVVFRQDTNVDVLVYLIVFLDGAGTTGLWHSSTAGIEFDPLTKAFNALYFISYIKVLFDESYSGEPAMLPPYAGSKATAGVVLSNPTADAITVPQGTYTFNDGVKGWSIPVNTDIIIQPSDQYSLIAQADTVGSDADLAPGVVEDSTITPAAPAGLVVTVATVNQGTNPGTSPIVVSSLYFDLSLALAYLCKNDIKLSQFWSLVKVDLPVQSPDLNVCWIRSATAAEEIAAITSISTGDRQKYYWGALRLMGALNTMVIAHSESVNIIAEVLAAWFTNRNSSGQYVGNKLYMLRLSGTRIKPFGYPSWLNSEVNVNDEVGFDILDAKEVGYLSTIADNTPQESALSRANSVTGMPVNALMISKFVDYTSAQQCAKLITDKGTLTNPVLTDQKAYAKIQEIVKNNLLQFASTGRLIGINTTFPDFADAKSGLSSLEAASAWSALYVGDLTDIMVTGGITAE
jgi:hypothetical protein